MTSQTLIARTRGMYYAMGIFLAMPVLGELLCLWTFLPETITHVIDKSKRRAADLLVLALLALLYFPGAFIVGYILRWNLGLPDLFAAVLALGIRFLVVTEGHLRFLVRVNSAAT